MCTLQQLQSRLLVSIILEIGQFGGRSGCRARSAISRVYTIKDRSLRGSTLTDTRPHSSGTGYVQPRNSTLLEGLGDASGTEAGPPGDGDGGAHASMNRLFGLET